MTKEDLLKFSFFGEKFFHNKPSGIDNVSCLYGNTVIFNNITNFKDIDNNIKKYFKIVLINTNIKRDTKAFVAKVSNFKNNNEQIFTNTINSINNISEQLKNIITSENFNLEKFKELITLNQKLLEILQVSIYEIEEILLRYKKHNIIGKLTGAGGGGFIILFVEIDKYNDYLNITNNTDINSFQVEFNTKGFEIINKVFNNN